MSLFDDLQQGMVSRRRLLELLSSAAGTAALAQGQDASPAKPAAAGPDQPKFSPSNIGGGGRIERDFYREWIKKSKVPMLEGYSLLDAAKQEVLPWPETGGRGIYLNFSGNVHMDAVIEEIAPGKALEPKRHFYEQLTYVLGGRGHTTFGEGNKANRAAWGEGSLFTVPVNVLHRH